MLRLRRTNLRRKSVSRSPLLLVLVSQCKMLTPSPSMDNRISQIIEELDGKRQTSNDGLVHMTVQCMEAIAEKYRKMEKALELLQKQVAEMTVNNPKAEIPAAL